MSPLQEAADALLAGGWPEDAIMPDEAGAASLSPRWSAVLLWSPKGELQGEGWTATVQLCCVPVAIRTGKTAERALSVATVEAARIVADRLEDPMPAGRQAGRLAC